jgi:hypothetical protein
MLGKLPQATAPWPSFHRALLTAVSGAVSLGLLGNAVGPGGRSARALVGAGALPVAVGRLAPAASAARRANAPGTSRRAVASASPAALGGDPYRGLGTWVDMYSWSDTFTNKKPSFGPADVDAVSADGVQTLYLQGASQTGDPGVLEPGRLLGLIARAHRRRLRVVVWYMPTLTDLTGDYARLVALGRLPVDGVGVDIESRDDPDVVDRTARLITLSQVVRRAMPRMPLGAIVLPPSLLEVVNPNYWPAFPWQGIAPYYDAWLPMTYWTDRLAGSGYRDGYSYTADSVIRLRKDLGLTGAAVHPIGGDASQIGAIDMDRFVAAVRQTNSEGGSLYEWRGTAATSWSRLRTLRR